MRPRTILTHCLAPTALIVLAPGSRVAASPLTAQATVPAGPTEGPSGGVGGTTTTGRARLAGALKLPTTGSGLPSGIPVALDRGASGPGVQKTDAALERSSTAERVDSPADLSRSKTGARDRGREVGRWTRVEIATPRPLGAAGRLGSLPAPMPAPHGTREISPSSAPGGRSSLTSTPVSATAPGTPDDPSASPGALVTPRAQQLGNTTPAPVAGDKSGANSSTPASGTAPVSAGPSNSASASSSGSTSTAPVSNASVPAPSASGATNSAGITPPGSTSTAAGTNGGTSVPPTPGPMNSAIASNSSPVTAAPATTAPVSAAPVTTAPATTTPVTTGPVTTAPGSAGALASPVPGPANPAGLNAPGAMLGGPGNSGSLGGGSQNPSGAAVPSSASNLPGFYTLNPPDRLAMLSGTATAQAVGGAGASAPGSNVLGQIFTGAMLSQVMNNPAPSGNTGGSTSRGGLASPDSGNTSSSSSTDLRPAGDLSGINLPVSKDGVLGLHGSLLTPLSETSPAPTSPLQDSLTANIALPAVNAVGPPPQGTDLGTSGRIADALPSPQPIPEPSTLALLGLAALAFSGRALLRRVRGGQVRVRRFVTGH